MSAATVLAGHRVWELLAGQRPFTAAAVRSGLGIAFRPRPKRRRGEDYRAKIFAACRPIARAAWSHVLKACLEGAARAAHPSPRRLRRQFDLCLRSDVQDLLRPRRHQLASCCGDMPLWLLLAAGVLPNMVASGRISPTTFARFSNNSISRPHMMSFSFRSGPSIRSATSSASQCSSTDEAVFCVPELQRIAVQPRCSGGFVPAAANVRRRVGGAGADFLRTQPW